VCASNIFLAPKWVVNELDARDFDDARLFVCVYV